MFFEVQRNTKIINSIPKRRRLTNYDLRADTSSKSIIHQANQNTSSKSMKQQAISYLSIVKSMYGCLFLWVLKMRNAGNN